MEELRSTEILDREIRKDSVKKAEKIVARAEEEAQKLLISLDDDIKKAREDEEKKYEERLSFFKKNLEAVTPLEKQRIKVSFVYESILEEINSYFESLSEDKRLSIIKNLAEKAVPLLKEKNFKAFCAGLSPKKVSALLKNLLGEKLISCEDGGEAYLTETALPLFKHNAGIVLVAEDFSVTCRLTLELKVQEILDRMSLSLSETLFDGGLDL